LTIVGGASVEVLATVSLVGPWCETPLHCVVDLQVGHMWGWRQIVCWFEQGTAGSGATLCVYNRWYLVFMCRVNYGCVKRLTVCMIITGPLIYHD
jgi:hypothetical protein